MKNIITALLFLIPFASFSQGQIVSITVDPASPTTADSVTVYVELMFPYAGCEVDNQSHSTSGNQTTASAHHCIGMLTVICNTTDTFELGYVQQGNHQFDFILTSGSGGPGCTPGIVPDDSDVLNFTVSSAVGIAEVKTENLIQLFPNPVNSTATVVMDQSIVGENTALIIVDATGKEIFSRVKISTPQIELQDLSFAPGIYFLQVISSGEIKASKKFMVE